MEKYLRDIDGHDYYINLHDAKLNFNETEITLAHLLRNKLKILKNKNISDKLLDYFIKEKILKKKILEIGCGLGDMAFNMLQSESNKDLIAKYTLLDISPALHEYEKGKLCELGTDFIRADCLNLSNEITNFDGLIICHGMIADLRSVFLNSNFSLENYNINNADFSYFIEKHLLTQKKEGFYFHVGSFLLLREMYKIMSSKSMAYVSEYAYSELNQPSLFGNHYECGIDFEQIKLFAEFIGFKTKLVDIEEILEISPKQKFLTMDVFVKQDYLVRKDPAISNLWKLKNPLPVLAYTEDHLKKYLQQNHEGLTSNELNDLLKTLHNHFYTIHDVMFDHKNPTTWSYKCMILSKEREIDDLEIIKPHVLNIIQEYYDIDKSKALEKWDNVTKYQKMGLEDFITPELVILKIFLFICKVYGDHVLFLYGDKIWIQYGPKIEIIINKFPIPNEIKEKVSNSVRNKFKGGDDG